MNDVVERFYMLVVFVWASVLQAATWPPIAAAPDASKHSFPGLSKSDIMMQLNFGPIAQMLFIPIALKLLSGANGVQLCVRLGVVTAVASAGIRLWAVMMPLEFRETAAARWMLQVAGMACGISGAFLQGCPTRFSALWFPPNQRARATGCAFVGLGLGQALVYGLCPIMVPNTTDLINLFIFQVVLAVPPCIGCFLYFPERPRIAWWLASSDASADPQACLSNVDVNRQAFLTPDLSAPTLTLKVVRQPSCFLVAAMCGLANGPYQAWGAALPTILNHLNFSSSQNDMFSFGSLLAYTAGCYIIGELGDRVFRKRLKLLLTVLLSAAVLSFMCLCLMLPTSFRPTPLVECGFPVVLLTVALTGWFVGATNPICMELCAELTHPVPEGISANLSVFITQVFSVILLALVPLMDPLLTTPLMASFLVFCGFLLAPVKEHYRRSAAESALKPVQNQSPCHDGS